MSLQAASASQWRIGRLKLVEGTNWDWVTRALSLQLWIPLTVDFPSPLSGLCHLWMAPYKHFPFQCRYVYLFGETENRLGMKVYYAKKGKIVLPQTFFWNSFILIKKLGYFFTICEKKMCRIYSHRVWST